MNKRRLWLSTILLALVLVFSALGISALASQAGSSKTKYTNDFSKGTSEYTLFDLNLEVPDSWDYYLNAEKNRHEFRMNDGDFMLVQMVPAGAFASDKTSLMNHLSESVFSGYTTDWMETDEYSSSAFHGMVTDAELISGGKNYNAVCFTLRGAENVYHIGMINQEDARYDYNRDLVRIIESGVYPASSAGGSETSATSRAGVAISQPVITQPAPAVESNYVVNTNTLKFHKPSCRSVSQIKDSNRWDYTGSRDWLISQGYTPCKNCDP